MERGAQALEELPKKMRKVSQLTRNVKAEDIRSLKAMVTPLGGAELAPAARYLDSWWKSVERAIKAIDAGCDVVDLPKEAIEMIAPVLLGQAAWELVCEQDFDTWSEFRGVVEDRFGMLKEFQRDLFLQIEREGGEDGSDFIRRVEDTRVRLKLSHEGALMKTWGNLPEAVTS